MSGTKEAEGKEFFGNVGRRGSEHKETLDRVAKAPDSEAKRNFGRDAICYGKMVNGAFKNVYPDK